MFTSRREGGASLVEFALVLPLLLALVLGMTELGLAFRDYLTISSGSREGARRGVAVGQDALADCFILDAVEASLVGVPYQANLVHVRIFLADAGGNPTGTHQQYSDPGGGSDCSGNWKQDSNGYPPGSRNVGPNLTDLDLLGVEILYDHTFITNFVPGISGTQTWTSRTVMRMEPQISGGP